MIAPSAAAEPGPVLGRVVGALPGGEAREGQLRMCEAVAGALARREHLLVQAGTGTGKSLAYLVPALLRCDAARAARAARSAGADRPAAQVDSALPDATAERVVVVTATRALQEQLVRQDLPFLAANLGVPFDAALLKGRSNYLCLARHAELATDRAGVLSGTRAEDALLETIDEWAALTDSGDRADLPVAVPERVWDLLSVDSRECPGRTRCDLADGCFAEQARERAALADIVVVNTALYAQHLASEGQVLGPHSYVVVDEAHTLEDICSAAFGVELGPTRVERLHAGLRTLFVADSGSGSRPDDPLSRLADHATRLEGLLESCPDDARLDLSGGEGATYAAGLRELLAALDETLAGLVPVLAGLPRGAQEVDRRVQRVGRLLDGARADVQRVLSASVERDVVWVEARPRPALRCVAIDIGPALAATLFARRTAVLTSATLAAAGDFQPIAWRVGLRPAPPDSEVRAAGGDEHKAAPGAPAASADPADATDGAVTTRQREAPPADPGHYVALDVGSPFDYRGQAILYVAAGLPDPRAAAFEDEAYEEAAALVRAAGGRALCLCTSLRGAAALAGHLRERLDDLDLRVLTPDDLPRGRLTEEFAADETSVLVGSMGLWQGLDVPGPAVSLVVIDKIPFARPTDPLAVARREQAAARGRDPFETFDLPRAATLLAQGAGRLIRSAHDRGVVAVLDRRLVTSRYGARLVASLPPMYRLTDPARVKAALARLRDSRATPARGSNG